MSTEKAERATRICWRCKQLVPLDAKDGRHVWGEHIVAEGVTCPNSGQFLRVDDPAPVATPPTPQESEGRDPMEFWRLMNVCCPNGNKNELHNCLRTAPVTAAKPEPVCLICGGKQKRDTGPNWCCANPWHNEAVAPVSAEPAPKKRGHYVNCNAPEDHEGGCSYTTQQREEPTAPTDAPELKSYNTRLMEQLTDLSEAKHYINAALLDSKEMFLEAVKDVAKAHKISKVAENSGMSRESLYRSLSKDGNPTFDTLLAVLKELGLEFAGVREVTGATELKPSPHRTWSEYKTGKIMQLRERVATLEKELHVEQRTVELQKQQFVEYVERNGDDIVQLRKELSEAVEGKLAAEAEIATLRKALDVWGEPEMYDLPPKQIERIRAALSESKPE